MTTVNDIGAVANLSPGGREEEQTAEGIREAAEQFESYLLRQLFQQMQKAQDALGPDGTPGGLAADFHRDTFAAHVADLAASQGGIGVADVLEKAWLESAGITESAADEPRAAPYTAGELRARLGELPPRG